MEKKNFFLSLLSPEGTVSSKRFAGLILIGFFIAGGIVGIVNDSMSEVVESILKTGLYTGVGLLGANVAENIVATVKRHKVVEPEVKTDEDNN